MRQRSAPLHHIKRGSVRENQNHSAAQQAAAAKGARRAPSARPSLFWWLVVGVVTGVGDSREREWERHDNDNARGGAKQSTKQKEGRGVKILKLHWAGARSIVLRSAFAFASLGSGSGGHWGEGGAGGIRSYIFQFLIKSREHRAQTLTERRARRTTSDDDVWKVESGKSLQPQIWKSEETYSTTKPQTPQHRHT